MTEWLIPTGLLNMRSPPHPYTVYLAIVVIVGSVITNLFLLLTNQIFKLEIPINIVIFRISLYNNKKKID